MLSINVLPTLKDIQDDILKTALPGLWASEYVCDIQVESVLNYIKIQLVNKIDNKQEFIHSLLNSLETNINYYNIVIKLLSYPDIFNIQSKIQGFSNISNNILFMTFYKILCYKINNNLYNLYNFVDNNLLDNFNIELLNCLLLIYYLCNPNDNDFLNKKCGINNWINNCSNEFLKLFLFKYNTELPLKKELNELKLTIKELKLELSKTKTKDNDDEYIEVN